MKAKNMCRLGLVCCCVLLISAAVAGLQGCVSPAGNTVVAKPEQPSIKGEETKAWEDGTQAFNEGDFGKAQAIFEALSESAESDIIRSHALYGVAACRLILARNPKEFAEAMAAWDCWAKLPAGQKEGEDPRMMTPFLQNVAPPSEPSGTRFPEARKYSAKGTPTYNNLVATKNLLQAREKELERVKARLDAREKENRRLRHQIETLENIHLKFQEKKQEVSTP